MEDQPLAGTVWLIPISHLDTQWRWTVRDTAARLLPATVGANAAAFGRFPSYCVNFDGAFRYRLAGTMSRDLRGVEVTGHSVLELVPQQHGLRLWNDLCEMQRERSLQYVQISVIASSGEPMSYRVLRLPLGADGETMDMVMVVQDYGNSLPLLRKYFDDARGGSR